MSKLTIIGMYIRSKWIMPFWTIRGQTRKKLTIILLASTLIIRLIISAVITIRYINTSYCINKFVVKYLSTKKDCVRIFRIGGHSNYIDRRFGTVPQMCCTPNITILLRKTVISNILPIMPLCMSNACKHKPNTATTHVNKNSNFRQTYCASKQTHPPHISFCRRTNAQGRNRWFRPQRKTLRFPSCVGKIERECSRNFSFTNEAFAWNRLH